MKLESYFKSCLERYHNDKDDWNFEDGIVLLAAKDMYEATGDERYFCFVENDLRNFAGEDGSVSRHETENFNIDSVNIGKVLFFLYDKTGDEKYRRAIEILMDGLRSQPGCGTVSRGETDSGRIRLDGLFKVQPFYMEYETRYDKKEKYNDILSRFTSVQQSLCRADEKAGCLSAFGLRGLGFYLMALVDTMDNMSIEIFEQYKKLQTIFKQALSGVLLYQDAESRLFYEVIDRRDMPGNVPEISGSAMIAYAILKGCRMGILLREKYVPRGEEILRSLTQDRPVERDGRAAADDLMETGLLVMAYAELLKLRRETE